MIALIIGNPEGVGKIISPLQIDMLSPLKSDKSGHEVFGFAPFWTLNKLDNVNFSVLTTLAYFGVPIKGDGNLDTQDYGYARFLSDEATNLFKKAHENKTRVVLTLTIMDNDEIEQFLDDRKAQDRAIKQSVQLVTKRGIDGINVDVEYIGNPGSKRRAQFVEFVRNLTEAMHKQNSHSKVSVSVYAASAKYPKLYDIKELAKASDSLFMMAYDFATTGSDKAMPTAPLKGYKEGKYWYDVESAVNDFLTQMPAEKLILGVPYYGYNYTVEKPSINARNVADYYWNADAVSQTYSTVVDEIKPEMDGISSFKTGWDSYGEVSWKAYYREELGLWRIIFTEDKKSLGLKYDFAKEKNLKGVGIWALGFDEGKPELWNLLSQKFGKSIAKADIRKGQL